MIPYPWEFPEKKYGKKFFNGDFHAIHYPMGNYPPHLFPWEIPTFYHPPPMGNPHPIFSLWEIPTFFTNPLWEIPTIFSPWETLTFFINSPMGNPLLFHPPPMGNPSKKIWKKIFLRDIWTTVPPKMGVSPGERGHGGIPTPPYGIYGGGDYQDCLL